MSKLLDFVTFVCQTGLLACVTVANLLSDFSLLIIVTCVFLHLGVVTLASLHILTELSSAGYVTMILLIVVFLCS